MLTRPLAILIPLLLAAPCCAQSVDFNGTTSTCQHTTAAILNGATTITVCVHFNADGQGEGNNGVVFILPEGGSTSQVALYHNNSANTMLWQKGCGAAGTNGTWSFPCTDGQWNAVAVTHDFTTDAAPLVRVNYASATVTQVSAPSGIQDAPATGYGVGNNTGTLTWDGRIAYMQAFNTILTAAQTDQSLRAPGAITSGLRLYLPMTSSTDINDASGQGFNATGANLATGADGPGVYFLKKMFLQSE